MTEIDRSDPRDAAEVFANTLGGGPAVRFAAAVVARSIDAAHREAPASWAVSLFGDRIRLNVGQVEVCTIQDGQLHLLVTAPIAVEDGVNLDLYNEPYYAAVPISSGKVAIPARMMDRPHAEVLQAHVDYVGEAARRKRGSPFRRAHSPGVVHFIEALLAMTLPRPSYDVTELPVTLAEEVLDDSSYVEGHAKSILVNAFERSAAARAACISHHGARCAACGLSFGEAYGAEFDGFIHVHHLVPLAKAGGEYRVDPIRDLRPLCPNCHAVVHLRTPPMSIEAVAALVRRQSSV